MNKRISYGGHVIVAIPERVPESTEWYANGRIERLRVDGPTVHERSSGNICATEEEAVKCYHAFGQQVIGDGIQLTLDWL